MKKLIILFLLPMLGWGAAKAQGGGDPEMSMMPPQLTFTSNQETCHDISFIYKCPDGNCILKIYSDHVTTSTSSGPKNTNWKLHTVNICWKNGPVRTKAMAYCEVNGKFQEVDDGCVVVVEGGG